MTITTAKVDISQPFCQYERFLPKLSEDRQKRIASLRRDKDKIISFFSELMLIRCISRSLNISCSEVYYRRNDRGKPYLSDNDSYHFSLSHSGTLIAFTEHSRPIGLDVELIKPDPRRTAERFFTDNERKYISSSPTPEIAFYEIWTAKEAYIKYLGTGLSTPLTSFDVKCERLSADIISSNIDGYMYSLCAQDISSHDISINDITQQLLDILDEL